MEHSAETGIVGCVHRYDHGELWARRPHHSHGGLTSSLAAAWLGMPLNPQSRLVASPRVKRRHNSHKRPWLFSANACSTKTVVKNRPLLPPLTNIGLIEAHIVVPRNEEHVLHRPPSAEDWELRQAGNEPLSLGQLLVRACRRHISRNGNQDRTARIVERKVLLQFVEKSWVNPARLAYPPGSRSED